MRFLVCAVALAFIYLGTPNKSLAATFTPDDLGTSATMHGDIAQGDAERLVAVFTAVKPIATYYPYPSTLYLNSPGGDVSEAIRLAELVRTLGLTVAVAPDGGGICASSCFLIYVAAIERNATGIDTIRAAGSKGNLGPIGVHRPYLRETAVGPSGARQQEQLMAAMREHLTKFGVGHTLIDKMMSHASNDIYWLNAEDIRSLGRFPAGMEEQLIAKCGHNSKREAKLSARQWIESLESGSVGCVNDYIRATYSPLQHAAVNRLREGWRPWR